MNELYLIKNLINVNCKLPTLINQPYLALGTFTNEAIVTATNVK